MSCEATLDYIPRNYSMTHDWFCAGIAHRNDAWALWAMQMDRAWDIARGASSVIVAIMDTGMDWKHPFLAANIWQNTGDPTVPGDYGEDADHDGHTLEFAGTEWVFDPGDVNAVDDDGNGKLNDFVGWDFNYDDNNPLHWSSQDSHGTQMGSIVSTVTDTDTLGSPGMTWYSRLMGLRMASDIVTTDMLIAATNYAVEKGADIVNMSFSPDPRIRTQLF